jgi:hypothetical protein
MDKLYAIVAINGIVFVLIFFMSHKKISKLEVYVTSLFSAFISLVGDIIMGLFFDTFYYFEKGIEGRDLIFHVIIYPATNLLFLNYFPIKEKIIIKAGYIIFWTLVSLGIEVIYVSTGIFVYQNWNFFYSAIVYPILFIILHFHLKLIRKLAKQD